MAEPRRVAEPRIVAELGRPETPEETAARKAQNSRNYRESKTTRNLVVALVASLAVMLFFVLVVVRPDGDGVREPVDYAQIAADSTASAPLVVPELPEGWVSNKAAVSTGNDGVQSWYIGFVTPENQFAAVTQGIDANPSWVAAQLGEIRSTGTSTIDGVEWTLYDNRDAEKPGNYAYAMTAEVGGNTFVLNGTAFEAEFTQLAEAVTR